MKRAPYRQRPLISLFCVLTSLCPIKAFATAVETMGTAELVAQSDSIIRGRVIARAASWDPGHTRIYTDVTVHVEEIYKGPANETLTVRRLGGSVDGIAMRTIGEAQFADNEAVFLFLRRLPISQPNTVYQTVGMTQGKFQILPDAGSAARADRRVARDTRESTVFPAAGGEPQTLVELERQVRAIVGGVR
jgi:hypothetical protein